MVACGRYKRIACERCVDGPSTWTVNTGNVNRALSFMDMFAKKQFARQYFFNPSIKHGCSVHGGLPTLQL